MGKKLLVGLVFCLLLTLIGCGNVKEIYNVTPESSVLNNPAEKNQISVNEIISKIGYSVSFSYNTEIKTDESGFEFPYTSVSAIISDNGNTVISVLIADDIIGGGMTYDEERLSNSYRVSKNAIAGCLIWYAGGGSEIIATYHESNDFIVFLQRDVDEVTPSMAVEDCYGPFCEILKIDLNYYDIGIVSIGNRKSTALDATPPDSYALTVETEPTATSLPMELQAWQDAYAELLRGLNGNKFILCDIDSDGIPELLVGGPLTDTDKYAEYNVYTYKNETIECIGVVSTLSWSCLWLDNNGGILGYSYGAGSGGTYRYYIDDGVLCYDGEVYGYFYGGAGNQKEWFRDSDGSVIIVTEETADEYQRIWTSNIELESYDTTETNISILFQWDSDNSLTKR